MRATGSTNPQSPKHEWVFSPNVVLAACRYWSGCMQDTARLESQTKRWHRAMCKACSGVFRRTCLLGGPMVPPGLPDVLVLWFSSLFCSVPLLSFFHYSREYCLSLRCSTFHCSWVAVFCSSWKSVCLDRTVCQELNSDRLCASSYIFVRMCHVLEVLNRRNSITGFCLMFRFCSLTNSFYGCKLHTNTFVVRLHPISRLLISSPTARNCPKKMFWVMLLLHLLPHLLWHCDGHRCRYIPHVFHWIVPSGLVSGFGASCVHHIQSSLPLIRLFTNCSPSAVLLESSSQSDSIDSAAQLILLKFPFPLETKWKNQRFCG